MQQELGGVAITWEHFKKVFFDRFFPQAAREIKSREFADFVQGSMMVEQYAAKFIELSRFAMYLISNKARKSKKCEYGLNQTILDRIIALRIRNFSKLVYQATIIEHNFQVSMNLNSQMKHQAQ